MDWGSDPELRPGLGPKLGLSPELESNPESRFGLGFGFKVWVELGHGSGSILDKVSTRSRLGSQFSGQSRGLGLRLGSSLNSWVWVRGSSNPFQLK